MSEVFAALAAVLPLVLVLSVRTGIALATLPAPLGANAPMPIRAALGVMLAIAIAGARTGGEILPLEPIALGAAALGEAAIGLSIGLVARAAISAAEVAGEMAASAMGLSFASSIDPNSGEQVQLPAQILGAVGTVLFFALRGHHVVIAALAGSVRLAPPGRTLALLGSADSLVVVGAEVLGDGLRIASPIVATMLAVQLAVGLAARAAPRLQVFTLSFATAATLGLFALWLAAPTMLEAMAASLGTLAERIDGALGGA